MTDAERCQECGSWEAECSSEAPLPDCGCARCARVRLVLLTRERDETRAQLAAELPAAWREDLESLNECLERVDRERCEALAKIEKLEKVRAAAEDVLSMFDAMKIACDRGGEGKVDFSALRAALSEEMESSALRAALSAAGSEK